MITETIRVSMPLAQLLAIMGVCFLIGFGAATIFALLARKGN